MGVDLETRQRWAREDQRLLTEAQHDRLDRIADERPDATVIGWSQDGPVIRYGTTGAIRLVAASGTIVICGGRL